MIRAPGGLRQRQCGVQVVGNHRQTVAVDKRGGDQGRGRADREEERRPVGYQPRNLCRDPVLCPNIERAARGIGKVRAALDERGPSVKPPQLALFAKRVEVTAHGMGRDVQCLRQLVHHDPSAGLRRFQNCRLPVHLASPRCPYEHDM